MIDLHVYGFADEASPQLSGQIAAMQRNGLQGLEIRNVDGENVADISREKAKLIQTKLSEAGLVTWSIGSPIGKIELTDDFSAHLDKFKHTLEIAHILGAKNLRMFSFFMPRDQRPETCRDQVMEWMSRLVEAAEGSGIVLCHENEKGIYGDIPARCKDIFETFPNIKGIFDPANFVQCEVDTWEAWQQLHSYIHYMHIKDACSDGAVVPAGMGAGQIKRLVEAYVNAGGRHFTMEPHLTVFDGLSALEREGEESVVGGMQYPDADTAFDAGCQAFFNVTKEVLK